MKLQAKDVKVGMTIKGGVLTVEVEKIEVGFQKNGKETITFWGKTTRSMGRGFKPADLGFSDWTVKSDTLVSAI